MEAPAEHGEDGSAAMMTMTTTTGEEEGWQTPRREGCRIPVVPPCPAAPPRKKAVAMAGLGGSERRDPPEGGYFQPPDLESLFVLVPTRRRQLVEASTCA